MGNWSSKWKREWYSSRWTVQNTKYSFENQNRLKTKIHLLHRWLRVCLLFLRNVIPTNRFCGDARAFRSSSAATDLDIQRIQNSARNTGWEIIDTTESHVDWDLALRKNKKRMQRKRRQGDSEIMIKTAIEVVKKRFILLKKMRKNYL